MKITEVRELSADEIRKQIAEEEETLSDLRFSHALKQLTNTAKLRHTRKTIARLKTVLHEEEKKAAENEKEVKTGE